MRYNQIVLVVPKLTASSNSWTKGVFDSKYLKLDCTIKKKLGIENNGDDLKRLVRTTLLEHECVARK